MHTNQSKADFAKAHRHLELTTTWNYMMTKALTLGHIYFLFKAHRLFTKQTKPLPHATHRLTFHNE